MSVVDDTLHMASERAGEVAGDAGSAVRDTATDLVDKIYRLGKLVRGVSMVSALSAVGLQKKRGAMPTIVAFGAGVVIGAGAALIFAPTSGRLLRRKIANRVRPPTAAEARPSQESLHRMDTDYVPGGLDQPERNQPTT
jgi:hypothetical protein